MLGFICLSITLSKHKNSNNKNYEKFHVSWWNLKFVTILRWQLVKTLKYEVFTKPFYVASGGLPEIWALVFS